MKKCILLDRDGVINYDSLQYIKNLDEFIFIPGSIDAIVRLSQAGYKIGIATNQSGVSRVLYSETDLLRFHDNLLATVSNAGGSIDAIEYCIHLPEEKCFCRKPQPGMLLNLAKKFDTNLHGVPFVGDRISDIQAALSAGASPIMVLSKMTSKDVLSAYPSVPIYHSLLEYVEQLLQ